MKKASSILNKNYINIFVKFKLIFPSRYLFFSKIEMKKLRFNKNLLD